MPVSIHESKLLTSSILINLSQMMALSKFPALLSTYSVSVFSAVGEVSPCIFQCQPPQSTTCILSPTSCFGSPQLQSVTWIPTTLTIWIELRTIPWGYYASFIFKSYIFFSNYVSSYYYFFNSWSDLGGFVNLNFYSY